MLDGDSVNFRLQVSSNFVSGIYSIAEILIAVAFKRFITLILECRNVKRIYAEKKSVELTSSSLWICADHGLTLKTLHYVTLCISALLIVLGVIGGFAIVGVTETDFETASVKNLVKNAPSDSLVDFEKHVSIEEGLVLVSGTVLLLREFPLCQSETASEKILYHYTNDLDDISAPKWPLTTRLFNSTCVTKASGYEERTALELEYSTGAELVLDETGAFICSWTVNEDEIPLGNVTKMQANENECRFRFLETWCFRSTRFLSCVAHVQYSDGYSTSQIWRGPESQQHDSIDTFRQSKPVDSRILKSMAFLGGAGVEPIPDINLSMAFLTVEENASVKRLVGNRNVTEINGLLFCLTFGLALLITTALGIVALFEFLFVLLLPGRLEYNRFSSATDMLRYAALEAFRDEDHMRQRDQAIAVGLSPTEPHVGPLKEPLGTSRTVGEEYFHEEELVGRPRLLR